jgi:hypothetical protein
MVLFITSTAAAWGFTDLHATQGNVGLADLPQAPSQAQCMTHLLLLWGREKKPGGSREEHMQGHAGRAMLRKRSNKEACSMKAQGHAAHKSMQDGVAGPAWYCGSVQARPMTLLYKHIVKYALAERCLMGMCSM